MPSRTVFVVSDRTGITAELLSHSLLSQFPDVEFNQITLPFIDDDDKVAKAIRQIDEVADSEGHRSLVFATFVNRQYLTRLMTAKAKVLDFFDAFVGPLEAELGVPPAWRIGQAHGIVDKARYASRISAVHYAMDSDDGVNVANYPRADLILVGVSRSGKTPTSVYLAMHFGLYCANYPLTEDDFERDELPNVLQPHRQRVCGLTIDATRLQQIRAERRADSDYASLRQCRYEIENAESLFRNSNVPYFNTTSISIEEIATTIISKLGIRREMLG